MARMGSTSQEPPAVVIQEPQRSPIRLLVDGQPIEVGRDCAGILLTDPQISRRHLRLERHDNTVRVTDLDSTNGTRVNGDRIRGAHLLQPGQVIQLGATTIALITAAAEADPRDSGALTIVFVHIADRLELLDVHKAIVRRHIERHVGTEVDSLMFSFASAPCAVACMVDVQRTLRALARSCPTQTLRVSVGIHTGTLTCAPDVYVARVARVARVGEVLISESVHRLVEPCDAFTFGPSRTVTLEDFGPNHVLYPVTWDR
jgi:class 3 adenylate cyclase